MVPRVTVLMPAYNAGKYIGEAIQSVIDQTYSDWELLVVNDGSTDNTVEVVESFSDSRIRLLHNPENLRLIKTLNRGLEEALGEYIARLDSDDLATPDRLVLQAEALDADPELAILGGRSNVINENGELVRSGRDSFLPASEEGIQFASMFYNPFRHSAVMFRRDIVRAHGGYPEVMQNVEDFGLWCELIKQHKAINLNTTLCDYRVHNESVMKMAKKESKLTKVEPRLALTAPVYFENAMRILKDESVAKLWAENWPKVRYSYFGACNIAELRRIFEKFIDTLDPLDFESAQVLHYGLRKLSNYLYTKRQICDFVCVCWQLLKLKKKMSR